MHDAIVEADALTKSYAGQRVVDALTLSVERGCFWGLLGPNGAGKTTFLRMLIGNTPQDSGSLKVLGHTLPEQASEVRRFVGVVPQKDNLDPDFTVLENLQVYGAYFGLSKAQARQHYQDLLRFAALEGRENAQIGTLSGGMQRRLSVARALVNNPQLLVLDEPTTGLDPQARQLLWQRLRELRTGGMTLILTTHFMEEAERLCDFVTVMDKGRILDAAPPRTLIARHIEPQVVEVYGGEAQAWHERVGMHLAQRSERVGETTFYYTEDEAPLVAELRSQCALHYLHRPANLEDVFVKLTGRDLRDE
ncbi:MAG: ATP-binding cassette domain-containing protein [Chromatiales bacterium]|jgi:lipooligosaccharide transport system ATP-binding protein|nr:ATP-binding cassette domain-containing protein [Chromatiales bacterium]